MKITVIHGQSHKGSSYHITNQIINKILSDDKEIYEFFMPRDTPKFCIGCYKCFNESENDCPQSQKVQKIVSCMELSDIIVIDSPTYCYAMTGQLKTFFDHLGYMWLSHRPKEAMFNKVGIVVSTASGAGANKVTKALEQQLFWLGTSKVFRYSKNVNASSWETIPKKTKESIEKDTSKISIKAKDKVGKVSPSIKLKFIFTIMKMMQKSNDWNMVDKNYWKESGWLDKKRPW